jgi:hypothetical protein
MTALAVAVGIVGLAFAAVVALALRYVLVESRRIEAADGQRMLAFSRLQDSHEALAGQLAVIRDELNRLDNRTRTVVGR